MNFRKLYLFIFLPFVVVNVQAQYAWQMARTGTGITESWAIAADNFGNVFCAGYGSSGTGPVTVGPFTVPITGGFQPVWMKYNAAGAVMWAGTTTKGFIDLYDMTADAAGNLLLFGYTTSDTMQIGTFVLPNPSYPHGRYFIAKINPAGAVLWAVGDGSVSGYLDYSLTGVQKNGAMATDDSGNIFVSGCFTTATMTIGAYTLTNDTSVGYNDFFLAKYSPSGALIWAASGGGGLDDQVLGITVTSGDSVYIAGGFRSHSMTFGSSVITNPYSLPRSFVALYSPAGTPLWAQAAGGSNGAFNEWIGHDNTGDIYTMGSFSDTSIVLGTTTVTRPSTVGGIAPAPFLAKYTSPGVVAWATSVCAPGGSLNAYSAALSPCGKIWLSGGGSVWAAIVNPADTILIPYTYDGSFLVGYDLSGAVVAGTSLSAGGDDQNAIACDPAGNVYVCADREGAVTIGHDTLAAPGTGMGEQFYMAKFGKMPDTTYTHQGTTVCDSTALTAPPGAYYLWNDSETTQTRTVHAMGDYWVYVSSCEALVTTDTFHVTAAPLPPGIVGPAHGIVPCLPNLFTDSAGGGTWTSSNTALATINPTTGLAYYAFGLSGGTDTIAYTVGGCTVIKSVDVAFCEGVPTINQSTHVLLTPNPATTDLYIQISNAAYSQVSIINTMGQTLITQSITAPQTRINVAALPAGVYYARFAGAGDTRVVRWVKE